MAGDGRRSAVAGAAAAGPGGDGGGGAVGAPARDGLRLGGRAGALALVTLGGCALLIGGLPPDPAGPADRPRRGRAGGPGLTVAVGAAMSLLLAAGLLLAVWRGSFAAGPYPGGWFGAAAVGRAF